MPSPRYRAVTQAEIDRLVERRLRKQQRHHARELMLLISMCAALARECARLRYLLRVDRHKKGRKK